MTSDPTKGSQLGSPGDAPGGGTLHELYDVASIRHVMIEIGKLSSKVDRLIQDVADNSKKTSELTTKIATFETTAKVVAGGLVILGGLFWWALGDKVKILVDEAFKSAYSAQPIQQPSPPTPPRRP